MNPELYKAAISGSERFSEKLRGVDLNLQTSQGGNSILHIAAKSGKEHIAEEILNKPELQSLLYKENFKGNTPLHVAATLGHFGMTKLLISRAGEQDLEVHNKLLKMVNLKKDTVLHDAVRNGHYDIVQLLIEEDPDLTSFTNSEGESPLFLAVDREFYNIAQHILEKVPDCSYKGRNSMNVLHAAVIRTSRNFVGKVLNKRSSANTEEDEFGWIPLHYAASLGSEEVVKLFMNFDTSLAYKKDKEGMSALHIASKFGNVDAARTLIGICPDTSELLDNRGRTALHVALENGKRNVLIFFLQTLAFQDLINEQDNEGNTPLLLSAIKRHYDLSTLMAEDRRVDKGAMNAAGLTTIDIVQSDEEFQKNGIIQNLERENGRRSLVQVLVHKKMTLETNRNNGEFEENERRKHDDMNLVNVNLLVATFVAAVTFQAAFQVPGGYNQDGLPNLRTKSSFTIFLFADSLAFSLSAAAIVTSFMTTLIPQSIAFKYPRPLVVILTLMSSLCMILAFLEGINAVFTEELGLGNRFLEVINVVLLNYVPPSKNWISMSAYLCFFLPYFYLAFRYYSLTTNKFKLSERMRLSLLSFMCYPFIIAFIKNELSGESGFDKRISAVVVVCFCYFYPYFRRFLLQHEFKYPQWIQRLLSVTTLKFRKELCSL